MFIIILPIILLELIDSTFTKKQERLCRKHRTVSLQLETMSSYNTSFMPIVGRISVAVGKATSMSEKIFLYEMQQIGVKYGANPQLLPKYILPALLQLDASFTYRSSA